MEEYNRAAVTTAARVSSASGAGPAQGKRALRRRNPRIAVSDADTIVVPKPDLRVGTVDEVGG